MSTDDTSAALPYRARPPQVLLGVGAVLLVSAGATVASVYGGVVVRLLLLLVAGTAAWFSLRSARGAAAQLRGGPGRLRRGARGGSRRPAQDGDPALLLAAAFLVLHFVAPTTAAWPLVSWAAFQLAVLRSLDLMPDGVHTELYLCVSLLGLGIALFGRRVVGRLALLSTGPWWLAGVVGGSSSAWADDHGRQWFSADLMIAAGFGLLLARLREPLEPLLGPPRSCRWCPASSPGRRSRARSPRSARCR